MKRTTKKVLIIAVVLLINLIAEGQNLFLIGEKSYPWTETITLESNADNGYDLNVCVAKDGTTGLFGASTKTALGADFSGQLIIYLEDGNVLICSASEVSENVDDDAKTLYKLTADQLNKLKSSDIHTVKYTLSWFGEQNYSASNKGVKTSVLINEFFSEEGKTEAATDDHILHPKSTLMDSEKDVEEEYDPFGDGSFPEGSSTEKNNERSNAGNSQSVKGIRWGDFVGDGLFGRKVVRRANVGAITTEPGKVAVNVCVDQLGKVTLAKFDAANSTVKDLSIGTKAVDCAKQYVFDEDPSAPREQCGRLTFIFEVKQ